MQKVLTIGRSAAVRGALLLVLAAGAAHAGEFPDRPIEVIITSTPGSSSDVLTRFIGKGVADALGQPLVVVSKASANGVVGAGYVARAKPDGYTVFLGGNTTMAANVHLFKQLAYDPVKDFEPVTQLTINPLMLVVRADLPIHSVADLIAYAKARPGKLNYGAGNSGGKVSAKLLESLAGIQATEIPYKGASQAALELVAGRLDFMMVDPLVVDAFVKEGRLRPLAVTSAQRLSAMPDLPTMAEAGVKGYEYASWLGYFVPRGTPKPVIDALNGAISRAVAGPEAQRYFNQMGMIAVTTPPEGLARFQQGEIANWSKLVRISGLKAQ